MSKVDEDKNFDDNDEIIITIIAMVYGDDDIGDIDEIKVFGRGPRGVKCVSDILTQVDCPRNRFLVKMLMTSAIMIVLMMMMMNVMIMRMTNRTMQISDDNHWNFLMSTMLTMHRNVPLVTINLIESSMISMFEVRF